jgi:hypothetical protein
LIAAILFLATAAAYAEDPLDNAQATKRESVKFDGQTLELAWENDDPSETIKEFIPAGENLEAWTHLASIREYPNLNDPKQVVDNLVRLVKERSPQSPAGILENPKTGAVIIHFVVWPEGQKSPEDSPFVEFNIFRYQKRTGGGLVAQQYALRDYKRIKEFLRKLPDVRTRLIDEMAKSGLQPGK